MAKCSSSVYSQLTHEQCIYAKTHKIVVHIKHQYGEQVPEMAKHSKSLKKSRRNTEVAIPMLITLEERIIQHALHTHQFVLCKLIAIGE